MSDLPELVRFAVSGKTYGAALDPLATGVPDELGLPWPVSVRKSRGSRHFYEVTPSQAAAVLEHLDVLAECFSLPGEPESQAEARAIRRDAAALRKTLA